MSQHVWLEGIPIYRQLKALVAGQIMAGTLTAGDALPSVRTVAASYQLNPLTVSRAFQELADEGVVEKRRGLGMFVLEGAAEALLRRERLRFLEEEWPRILARIAQLGLDAADLVDPDKRWRA